MQTTLTELADLLGINEFELFEQAYAHWYGQSPKTVELESDFGKYIKNQGNLPVYVKSYIDKKHFFVA
jgi:hypothetical protein